VRPGRVRPRPHLLRRRVRLPRQRPTFPSLTAINVTPLECPPLTSRIHPPPSRILSQAKVSPIRAVRPDDVHGRVRHDPARERAAPGRSLGVR
jgi:hypothetical protein